MYTVEYDLLSEETDKKVSEKDWTFLSPALVPGDSGHTDLCPSVQWCPLRISTPGFSTVPSPSPLRICTGKS